MQDVLIIGGGVIGLSIAYELAGQGAAVTVADQSAIGQEASWAGAGILPPGNPDKATMPEARLRGASHRLWLEMSRQLMDETGIDNGYRRCGGLELHPAGETASQDAEIMSWRNEGVIVEPLDQTALRECEPAVNPAITAAYRLPEMGQVRNPRHLKALVAGCTRRGVKLLPGTPVHGFDRSGEKVVTAITSAGVVGAGEFVIASGAWSARLLAEAGCPLPLRPLRGQIVLLAERTSPFRHVLNAGPRYLVPRADGRILAGSTEENVGFDKRTTAGGIGGLIDFAVQLVPSLAGATVERTWAGLRPQSPDGLPYLGRIPGHENLFVAAGHFRAGLQLSPITAKVVSQLIQGKLPSIPLDAFAPDRERRQPRFGE